MRETPPTEFGQPFFPSLSLSFSLCKTNLCDPNRLLCITAVCGMWFHDACWCVTRASPCLHPVYSMQLVMPVCPMVCNTSASSSHFSLVFFIWHSSAGVWKVSSESEIEECCVWGQICLTHESICLLKTICLKKEAKHARASKPYGMQVLCWRAQQFSFKIMKTVAKPFIEEKPGIRDGLANTCCTCTFVLSRT